MSTPTDDTIDLGEIFHTLGREKRWLGIGLLVGLLGAAGVLLFVRPVYQASSTILLRTESERAPSALAMLGGLADALPNGITDDMDTELELLTSRAVYGSVIDSLFLQARVRSPHDRSPRSLFAEAEFADRPPEETYTFRATGNGAYSVEGGAHRGEARPGVPYELPGARVTLGSGSLPEEFRFKIIPREDAIDEMEENLIADEAGGEVAQIVYDGPDPETAAAVPNAIVSEYLVRRRTTDRGVNQHRYEFLRARADSVVVELADAAESLRQEQERSGVLEPEITGEAEIEGSMEVRAALTELQVQRVALQRLLERDNISGLNMAGFPALLESPAVNELISLLAETQTERESLLERRTPNDPEVAALTRSIALIEGQLKDLATDLLASLQQQEQELRSEMARYETTLAALPAQAQQYYMRYRDVERLAQTELVLQTQLIDARLAAISEGGNVRQVDAAVPPDEPDFPKPLPTLLIGLFGGLVLGVFGALGANYLNKEIRDPHQAELTAGVPAVAFQRNKPLLLGGLGSRRTALVVPVGEGGGVSDVAHRIAATARLQGREAIVADLSGVQEVPLLTAGETVEAGVEEAPVVGGALVRDGSEDAEGLMVYRMVENVSAERLRQALDLLESQHDLVVAIAPSLDEGRTAALLTEKRVVVLVGKLGVITRTELHSASINLRRLNIAVPGVVLTNGA